MYKYIYISIHMYICYYMLYIYMYLYICYICYIYLSLDLIEAFHFQTAVENGE